MKHVKSLLLLIMPVLFSSCIVETNHHHVEEVVDTFSLEELLSSYDLWYVDYHSTEGNQDIPFVSKAFTLSFLNGRMYANNNITEVGQIGNGFGIQTGNYRTINNTLECDHYLDGAFDFEVVQLSNNEIRIDCLTRNITYYLVGYQRNNFDYDRLFYDNIEYFLQEYEAWEQIEKRDGTPNPFDQEHYLRFLPENNSTFDFSSDPFGINIDRILWSYGGHYEVANVRGEKYLKILTLNYRNSGSENFELNVINKNAVELFHISSGTTYTFSGIGFIEYLRRSKKQKPKKDVKNNERMRIKIKRKTVERRHLK